MAYDFFTFILAIVATEASIELWKRAAPLQGVKRWMIRQTPSLYSKEQENHLLSCPWCCSVWMGFAMMAAYMYMDSMVFMVFAGSLTIARLSNFLHVVFSLIRDRQMDIRIARGR